MHSSASARVSACQMACRACFAFAWVNFRQAVRYVHGLVHPRQCSVACLGIDFLQCGPEAHRTVPDRQYRNIHPARFLLQQNLAPTLGRFPDTVFNRQKTLLSVLIDPDHHQGAQLGLFGP